jgi:CRP-like cAMP-binding protein
MSIKYRTIENLKDGDHFGEVALIEHRSRNTSAICKTDCHFAVLSREDFDRSLGAIERRKYNERI